MTDEELAEKVRQRYGTGTYRPPLRILFDSSYEPPDKGPSLPLAILLLAGAFGVGFWCAVGVLWGMGWITK